MPETAPNLFSSYRLGSLVLPNRIVMAPLTRGRAETDGTPSTIMAEYYAQRAAAGLIIAEATIISQRGAAWIGVPGVFSAQHVDGWRVITDGVKAKGGRMFLQLWHRGRTSHSTLTGGELPIAPSPIRAPGTIQTPHGMAEYEVPQEMTASDIADTVAEYRDASVRAIDAGFDGVEVHAANGYLIDQFLRTSTNHRTDDYGGSIENRTRFLQEVVQAVCSAKDEATFKDQLKLKNAEFFLESLLALRKAGAAIEVNPTL